MQHYPRRYMPRRKRAAHAQYMYEHAYRKLLASASYADKTVFTLEDISREIGTHAVFIELPLRSLLRRGLIEQCGTVDVTVGNFSPPVIKTVPQYAFVANAPRIEDIPE